MAASDAGALVWINFLNCYVQTLPVQLICLHSTLGIVSVQALESLVLVNLN